MADLKHSAQSPVLQMQHDLLIMVNNHLNKSQLRSLPHASELQHIS